MSKVPKVRKSVKKPIEDAKDDGNTAQRFELYHTLNQNIAKKDLKKAEKEEIIDAITKFTSQESQAMFSLINEDYKLHLEETKTDETPLPYNGRTVSKNSVEFDLADFPIRLRRILYKFVKIVQKSEQIRSSP